jgi:hypothetical protein
MRYAFLPLPNSIVLSAYEISMIFADVHPPKVIDRDGSIMQSWRQPDGSVIELPVS